MGGLASVVQLWLRNQLGSNCILHYESQCVNTGRRTGVHKAIILTNCQRAPALSCCSLTAYPSFLGIPCTSFWKSLWCNPDPHHTKRETAADPYLLWHSADHSAGGNCFNAAGSNLPSEAWQSDDKGASKAPGAGEGWWRTHLAGFKIGSPTSAWMCHGLSASKMHVSAILQSYHLTSPW